MLICLIQYLYMYIDMKYMEPIYLRCMFAWYLTRSTTDENGSCFVHHTCNMRNCNDISIAYAQGHQYVGCVCMGMIIHHQC